MKRTKTSDAQKRASVKYISEKRDRLTLSAPKGARDRWREAASAAGLTLNAWGLRALDAAAAAREMDGRPEPAETETGSQDHDEGRPDSPDA